MHRTAWFDEAWIERTVTRSFVCSHLVPEEIRKLDEPVRFGDGLTDHTYWEWIQNKTKRLFLILVDLGVPDQVFGVIDDSWEDDDLPVPLDRVDRLALTAERDSGFDKKFYKRQFFYLLNTLHRGQHIDYEEDELVPLHVVEKRPVGAGYDVVELMGLPGSTFCRRRISERLCPSKESFMNEVASLREMRSDHVLSYEASYTHQGNGYILLSPVAECRLGSYLTNTPPSIKPLKKLARRRLVLDWIHCLIDSLRFIHSRGWSLENIKPSTILFTHDNHLVLPDCARPALGNTASEGRASFDKESYDYAAPERWTKPGGSLPSPLHKTPSPDTDKPPFSIGLDGHQGTAPRLPTDRRSDASTSQGGSHAADVFSLGCIILELISHGLLKRSTSSFAAFRGAKHKSAGRGGAVPDSSFHKNLGRVEIWMSKLAEAAAKKADTSEDGLVFEAVTPMLHIVEKMLAQKPAERPSALKVQRWVYQILTEVSGIKEPHCEHVHQHSGMDIESSNMTTASRPSTLASSPERDGDSFFSSAAALSSASSVSRWSSGFGFVGRASTPSGNDDSCRSRQGSVYSLGDRWGFDHALVTLRNLRIGSSAKMLRDSSHAGPAVLPC